MPHYSAIRFTPFLAFSLALLLLCPNHAQAQNTSDSQSNSLPIIFRYDSAQIRIDLKDEIKANVKEARLEIYDLARKKVFDSGPVVNQSLVWRKKNDQGIVADGKYLALIRLRGSDNSVVTLFGQITIARNGDLLLQAHNIYQENPVDDSRALFKVATELLPNDPAVWLWYGIALSNIRDILDALIPPPPPPAAPPPAPGVAVITIPVSKEERQRDAEEFKRWQEEKKNHQAELKTALPVLNKAYQMAADCDIKDVALTYLIVAHRDLDNDAQYRQLLLKRADSGCISKDEQAATYYVLGVNYWACAYKLSSRYANKKSPDPFHPRNFANASDKQQHDNCVAKGLESIESTLALNPEYFDAFFYKGLFYREKQKATRNPARRKELAAIAQKLAEQGIALMNKSLRNR